MRCELVHLALDIPRLEQKSALAPLSAPLGANDVLGHSKEPGGRIGLRLELAESAVRDEEDLLHGVVDLDHRSAEMSGPARHFLMVERKELGQSPRRLLAHHGTHASWFLGRPWDRGLSRPLHHHPPDLSSTG